MRASTLTPTLNPALTTLTPTLAPTHREHRPEPETEAEGAPPSIGSACPSLLACVGRLLCWPRCLRGGPRRPLLADNTVSSTWAGGGEDVDDGEAARTARKRRGSSFATQAAVPATHEVAEIRRVRYE